MCWLCSSNFHAITWNAMKFGVATSNWSWGIHHNYKTKTSLPSLLPILQADRFYQLSSVLTGWLHYNCSSSKGPWLHHIYPQRNLARFGEKHNWKLSANTNVSLAHIRQICEWEMSRGFLAYYYLWYMDPGETYWPTFQHGLEKCNPNVNGKSRPWVFFVWLWRYGEGWATKGLSE